jgi:hypothetical protein
MDQKSAIPYKQPAWFTNLKDGKADNPKTVTAAKSVRDPHARIDNILVGLRKRGIVIEGETVGEASKSV